MTDLNKYNRPWYKLMKWFAMRFKYTKELRESHREVVLENCHLIGTNEWQSEMLDEYRTKEVRYMKLTLDEAETLFGACVDYQRALKTLNAGDPVQARILPIMEKYNITIDRNTVVDGVIEEYRKFLEEKQSGNNDG